MTQYSYTHKYDMRLPDREIQINLHVYLCMVYARSEYYINIMNIMNRNPALFKNVDYGITEKSFIFCELRGKAFVWEKFNINLT